MSIAAPSGHPRRYDLDWLRVIALALLIVYHVLCIFNSAPWMIKSAYAGAWADGLVDLLTPWRMTLVFLVGGAASRFLFEKFDAPRFALNRAQRLLIPFIIGVILIAPPQIYLHQRALGLEQGGFLEFWLLRFWSTAHLHGLSFPDPAHLWFLPYLFIYAVAAAFLWRWRPAMFASLSRWADRAPLALLVGLAVSWMVFVELVIEPHHHRTMVFFWDWNGHLRYAPAFLLGLLIAQADQFWRKLLAARWYVWGAALGLAAISYAAWKGTQNASEIAWLLAVYGAVTLFAFLAFGAAFLNKPSRALTYWNDAVLPIYVLHQTVLVLLAADGGIMHWHIAVALPLLVVGTFVVCEAIYHLLIRRSPWLRAAFGQTPRPRGAPHARAGRAAV